MLAVRIKPAAESSILPELWFAGCRHDGHG